MDQPPPFPDVDKNVRDEPTGDDVTPVTGVVPPVTGDGVTPVTDGGVMPVTSAVVPPDRADWSPRWGEAVSRARFVWSDALWPAGLLALTVFTTLWAGAYQVNSRPVTGAWDFLTRYPGSLADGWPFAVTLLGILITHECGHVALSLVHRVPASLPLFLPGFPQFIGTFGAIIRMRSPMMRRCALFDIGVAGPIAGFVVAVPALLVGLSLSTVELRLGVYGMQLGEPLLLQWLAWLVFGPLPAAYDIVLHPVAFAAWFGIFVTALNLLPIGQLDGGHVACAWLGDRQRTLAFMVMPILLVLGVWGWPGWLLVAALTGLLGVRHPPVSDPDAELGRGRRVVGWGAVVMFAVSFSPVPFYVG